MSEHTNAADCEDEMLGDGEQGADRTGTMAGGISGGRGGEGNREN